MAPAERLCMSFVVSCAAVVLLTCCTLVPSIDALQALPNIMPFKEVEYSSPKVNNDYQATTRFDPRGMGNLYNITKLFMRAIQAKEPYPQGLVRVTADGSLAVGPVEWPTVVAHYGRVLAVVLLGLLLAALLPVIGLLFCCCRCTGRCGSRSQPFDKRHDPCRRHCLGILLAAIAIALLFGVVCAFVTNEYMEQGVKQMPDKAHIMLNDSHLFIKNTKKEVNTLLITNYEQLAVALNGVLDNSGLTLRSQLANISRAVALDNLTDIVTGLGNVKTDLTEVNNLTETLQSRARILSRGLEVMHTRLLSILQRCDLDPSCRSELEPHRESIENLRLNEDFRELPDISESLHNVSNLVAKDIEKELLVGKQQLDRIQDKIQSRVNELIPAISSSITETGKAVQAKAGEITRMLDKADQVIMQNTEQPLEQGRNYLKRYSQYRYHLGLAVSCALLMILTPITFGLFCGFCGKRPDVAYGDDSCNKGTGSRLLMIAVWFIFLVSSALMIIVLAHFVLGIVGERAVCEPLREPQDNQIFALIDELFPLEKLYQTEVLDRDQRHTRHRRMQPSHPNISSVIVACHQNHSIYTVLNLDPRVNINQVLSYPERFQLEKRLKEIERETLLQGSIVILTPDARRKLRDLADSSLSSIDFNDYTKVLNRSHMSLDLNALAKKLHEVAIKIKHSPKESIDLDVQANLLEHYHHEVELLNENAIKLNATVTLLKEHLKLNQSSLKEAVERLMNEVEEAQTYLNERGPQELMTLARLFMDEFRAHVDRYMVRVVDHTKTKVGKCGPLSRIYNATLIATCDEILNPFNGFWASVGWCLLLFIPTIIFAVKLSTLYQKSDPYPGPLVEAEYNMYDAYADRDNIPLASVHDKKRKKTKQSRGRSYQETYDNSGGGGYVGDYSAHLGRGERERVRSEAERAGHSQGAQRYSDMAPKHWDFPNNGPPRYHGPHAPHSPPLSTEYERPPPYYFPGPGENRS